MKCWAFAKQKNNSGEEERNKNEDSITDNNDYIRNLIRQTAAKCFNAGIFYSRIGAERTR